jgi:hydrogenase maturation protease
MVTEDRVHVICFGNLWHGDDGFGIHVLRRLRAIERWPRSVRLFEAGISGLSALGYFEGCRKVVAVDAVRSGRESGHVRRFVVEELDVPLHEMTIHGFGLPSALAALAALSDGRPLPEVVLIGAEIGAITRFTDNLSAPLEAALDEAVGMVERECTS